MKLHNSLCRSADGRLYRCNVKVLCLFVDIRASPSPSCFASQLLSRKIYYEIVQSRIKVCCFKHLRNTESKMKLTLLFSALSLLCLVEIISVSAYSPTILDLLLTSAIRVHLPQGSTALPVARQLRNLVSVPQESPAPNRNV